MAISRANQNWPDDMTQEIQPTQSLRYDDETFPEFVLRWLGTYATLEQEPDDERERRTR